ncbi:MAG: AAA family ATPase [Oscillospiraceae bacterium]|nr:AAA family ATPase [Oscillospiraceae bacterium]
MENSIFEYSSYRIFCIFGNITDSFCTPDLQVMCFEEYLCRYLRNTGYKCVVFYSGGGMGLYFMDQESAGIYSGLINKNAPSSDDSEEDLFNVFAVKKKKQEISDDKKNSGIRMRYPMESDADFIHKTEALMKSASTRTAIVFTSLDDFVNRTDSTSRRNYNRLFETWKSMTSDNRNICIFLSKGLGSSQMQQMLSNNSELSVSSLFLTENEEGKKMFNSNCCISVNKPGSDEIRNLLLKLAICGKRFPDENKTRFLNLEWNEDKIDKIVSEMLLCCNRYENGLNTFMDRLGVYMKKGSSSVTEFTSDCVRQMYSQYHTDDCADDPLKFLESRKDSGWENAYSVIKRNLDEFDNYKASHNNDNFLTEMSADMLSLERFENLNREAFGYKVPNFVIQGNPGVGKTEIAKLIGRILFRNKILKSGHTVCASRDTLVGQYVGSSAINTVNAVERANEGVLFIDEVYSLISRSDSSQGENYCAEVINTLVAAMTDPKYHFCVVIAGYKSRMNDFFKMNEGLPSRFNMRNVITIEDYKPPVLEKIFRNYLSDNNISLDDKADSDLSCYFVNFYKERDRNSFGNARDVINLAKSVISNAQMRCRSQKTVITQDDFEGTKNLFNGFGASTREEAYKQLRQYTGMEFLEKMFDDQCSLYDECMDKNIEYPGPEHMIWVGNPGTGKSTAAKLTAQLYYATGILGGREPVIVDASSLIGTHVGDSQKLVRERMDEAKQHNTVLVIEEAYQLSKDEHYGHAALNAMMNAMTEERRDFNVVFIVYKSEYKEFAAANAGILSRCVRYDFNDYTPVQLTEIFKKMCRDSRDTYDEETLAKVSDFLKKLYENRNDKTGNARAVSRLLSEMRKRRYPRIRKLTGVPADEKYCFRAADVPDFRCEEWL